jgi:MFS transporter, DHA3 family, tetracycline resistance protein
MAWTMHVVFHIKNVGFQPFMLVFMGTLYEIAIMTCEVPTGVIADLKSRKLSSVIGWFILGLGFFVEGLFPIAPIVIVAQLILGFGETFVSGAHDAWVADEIRIHDPGVDAGTALLKGQQSSFLGRLCGTWISVMFSLISLPAVMMASGIGFMIFAFASASWMTEDGFHKSNENRSMWTQFKSGWNMVRASKILLLILAVSVFYGFASEGFDRLWNKTILDIYKMPKVGPFGEDFWWPVFSTGAIFGGMAVNAWVRKNVDLANSKAIINVMLVLTTILIFTIVGFALATSFTVTLLLFIASRSIRRALEPILKTWTNLHAQPENRATILSFSAQSHSIGEIGGGPIVGAIGQYQSAKMAVVVAGILLAPVLPVLGLAKKKS